jgi:ribonuclease G
MGKYGKMANSVLINVTRDETRVGLVEGGQVVEIYVERKRDVSIVGNIYMGKVVKILPGMQSAFVDIGLDKSAFLYVGDIRSEISEEFAEFFEEEEDEGGDGLEVVPRRRRQDLHIEELIQEGQELLVQVSKDPLGTKGARATSYVTIPGRYLVLMPGVDHVGISRRISNEDERARLKAMVEEFRPEGSGLIIRTASESAGPEDLRQDLEFLRRVWENIQNRRSKVTAPCMLYSDLDLRFRSVRDLMTQDVGSLMVDSAEDYDEILELVNVYFPKLMDRIELYEGSEPIFDHYGIELDIARALDRRVWLKSGGYIVLDQTEAMTVIDVNTGKFVGKEDLEDTILKTNLEAVKEIAYQIRLRNLGGIIIVDFIDMEMAENREKVFHAFQLAMSRDRARNTIFHISELGLIQMTRKRVRESLGRTLCNTCPYCEGKGFVKSPQTLAYEIMRKVQKAAAHGVQRIIVTAHPLVAELLSDEEREDVEEMEVQYGVRIIVTSDAKLHQENYDIATL